MIFILAAFAAISSSKSGRNVDHDDFGGSKDEKKGSRFNIPINPITTKTKIIGADLHMRPAPTTAAVIRSRSLSESASSNHSTGDQNPGKTLCIVNFNSQHSFSRGFG